MIELKEFYWAHRDVIRIIGASSGMLLIQLGIMVWTLRRLRELSHIRERMSRLADGLALLTDTTEAGLSTLIKEVQLFAPKQPAPRTASRSAVSKRVATAARKGADLARIAEREAISESEARLHLRVGDAARHIGAHAAE